MNPMPFAIFASALAIFSLGLYIGSLTTWQTCHEAYEQVFGV